MKLYLDNCCYNRPFDNQKFIKIKLETEAKLFIQEKVKAGKYNIVWSYILDFENSANPFEERKEAIKFWRSIAIEDTEENEEILSNAYEIRKYNMKSKDALHLACAIYLKCDYFITTDETIIKKMCKFERIKVLNPIEFINKEVKNGS